MMTFILLYLVSEACIDLSPENSDTESTVLNVQKYNKIKNDNVVYTPQENNYIIFRNKSDNTGNVPSIRRLSNFKLNSTNAKR